MDQAGISACAYRIEGKTFRVEARGTGLWALVDAGQCFNKLGMWEYEPQPSSRHADFHGPLQVYTRRGFAIVASPLRKAPMDLVSPTSFRLPRKVKEALQAAAEKETRTVTQLVVFILKGWLTEKGYLS